MPLQGRSPRSRRSDEEFVVFLQGIPAHCRWQELKDLVRQTALHIRQAVVYDDSHGVPTGLGQIIVKNEDEAWRTYHRLSTNGWEGQSLVVTLARTGAPTKPIAGPTRSPPAMVQGYTSGYSTPPRSQGKMAMPPSPISPESAQSTNPTFQYPEYGQMMGAMPMTPQQFMPMMDPMQCFPPSPLMHCSMFDPSWNMMPMYPISPVQPLHETGDGYGHYHPCKQWGNHADSGPSSPVCDTTQRAILIQNLSAATTAADLQSLLCGTGSLNQCDVTVTPDKQDSEGRPQGSALMHSTEDAQRAIAMLNNMTFMGARIRVKMDQRPGMTRTGSWDGTTATSEDSDSLDLASSDKHSECSECGQDIPGMKAVAPNRPLVVDGSGMQNRSLELLSTSAPT